MARKQLGAVASNSTDAITKGGAETLTNKTVDGSANTVSNMSGLLQPVRLLADGTYVHTISAGSVTQIAGTTIDGVSPAIGDRILVVGAPAATGAGGGYTTQPGNGIYVVTGNTTNLTLARAADCSGTVVPWNLSVAVREGTGWGLGYVLYWKGTGAFTWGTTALVGYSGYNRLMSGAFVEVPVDTASAQAISNKTETLAAGSTSVAPLKFTSGTNLTTAGAGAMEYDGTVFYSTPAASSRGLNQSVWMCRQDSAYTLTSSTAVQKLFNASANGAVTLPVGTYRFNCMYSLSAMSATSGNSAFSLAVGTAVIAAIQMQSIGQDAATATVGALSGATAVTSAFPASQHTAGVGTGQQSFVTGTFEVSTTGTVIPSVQLVTASAAVNAIGSFFECWLVGSQSIATIGNWS